MLLLISTSRSWVFRQIYLFPSSCLKTTVKTGIPWILNLYMVSDKSFHFWLPYRLLLEWNSLNNLFHARNISAIFILRHRKRIWYCWCRWTPKRQKLITKAHHELLVLRWWAKSQNILSNTRIPLSVLVKFLQVISCMIQTACFKHELVYN